MEERGCWWSRFLGMSRAESRTINAELHWPITVQMYLASFWLLLHSSRANITSYYPYYV